MIERNSFKEALQANCRDYCRNRQIVGNKVCMKGGKDIFTGEQEVEEWFVTQIRYEQRIVIAGKDYASTDAIYSF